MKKLSEINVEEIANKHDPILRTLTKKNWDGNKKKKYIAGIIQQATKKYPSKKIYQCFTKSGEVYVNDTGVIDGDGFIHGVSERSRAVQNSKEVGLAQNIQPVFFEIIKDFMPGFIQGLSKKNHKNFIKKFVKAIWKAISKDGSAF